MRGEQIPSGTHSSTMFLSPPEADTSLDISSKYRAQSVRIHFWSKDEQTLLLSLGMDSSLQKLLPVLCVFTFSPGTAKPSGDALKSPPWPLCVCGHPELWFVGNNFAGRTLWSSWPTLFPWEEIHKGAFLQLCWPAPTCRCSSLVSPNTVWRFAAWPYQTFHLELSGGINYPSKAELLQGHSLPLQELQDISQRNLLIALSVSPSDKEGRRSIPVLH